MRKVDAGRAVQWIVGAFELSFRNPAMFWGMGALVGLMALLPLVNLALIVIGPALLGGIAYAAREQSEGRPVEFPQLFQAFRSSDRTGPMLLLCLPWIGAAVVVGVLMMLFLGGAILAAFSGAEGSWVGLVVALLVLLPIGIVLGLLVFALLFFAVPRVLFDGLEAFGAMRESLRIALDNWSAMLVYVVVMFVLMVAVSAVSLLVLFVFPPLVSLVSGAVGYTIGGIATYLAYRDVFGGASSVGSPSIGPPQPPQAPA